MSAMCDKILTSFYGDQHQPGCPRFPLISLAVGIVSIMVGFGLSISSLEGTTAPEVHIVGVVMTGIGLFLCVIFLAIAFAGEDKYHRQKIGLVHDVRDVSEQTESSQAGSEAERPQGEPDQPQGESEPQQTISEPERPRATSDPVDIVKLPEPPKEPEYIPTQDLEFGPHKEPSPSFEVIHECIPYAMEYNMRFGNDVSDAKPYVDVVPPTQPNIDQCAKTV